MAFTTPSTWVAGEVLTAAQLNQQVRDNVKFLHGPPSVRVRRAAAQAITEGGYEEVSFDTEDWDTNTMWSSTAATKVFANTAGKYLVSVQGTVAVSTGGTIRGIGIRKNSTTGNPEWAMIGREPPSASFGQNPAVTGMVSMTTGQYVQLVIFHDHSTTLNTATGTDSQPTLSMVWMSS